MNKFLYYWLFCLPLISCTQYAISYDRPIRVGIAAFNTINGDVLYCDSIQMHSPTEATLYVDGKRMKVIGEVIQPGSNPNYKKQ